MIDLLLDFKISNNNYVLFLGATFLFIISRHGEGYSIQKELAKVCTKLTMNSIKIVEAPQS